MGRTDIPTLREDDSQEEDKEEYDGADPAVRCEGSAGIEIGLVFLYLINSLSRYIGGC